MSGFIWLYIIGGLLALVGVWTIVNWIRGTWGRVMATATDLSNTLREAAEIARAYREDLSYLRQFAQISQTETPNSGTEPASIIPPRPPVPATMPPPYFDRFPQKPYEEDAPLEPLSEVDKTATEEDLLVQESDERAADFETQERQKAAMREADQERLKQFTEASGTEEQ
jgi:hypothetical protein